MKIKVYFSGMGYFGYMYNQVAEKSYLDFKYVRKVVRHIKVESQKVDYFSIRPDGDNDYTYPCITCAREYAENGDIMYVVRKYDYSEGLYEVIQCPVDKFKKVKEVVYSFVKDEIQPADLDLFN